MNSATKHSPTPWEAFVRHDAFKAEYTIDCDAGLIRPPLSMPWSEIEANAAFIVRAVNAHDKLVCACKGVLALASDPAGSTYTLREALKVMEFTALKAALTLAEGGKGV